MFVRKKKKKLLSPTSATVKKKRKSLVEEEQEPFPLKKTSVKPPNDFKKKQILDCQSPIDQEDVEKKKKSKIFFILFKSSFRPLKKFKIEIYSVYFFKLLKYQK